MLFKSTLREIKSSLGRYLAIVAIIALGVGFFGGLKVTKPSMVRTLDDYLEDHKFFDYRLLSSIGFEEQDVEALEMKLNLEFEGQFGGATSEDLKAASTENLAGSSKDLSAEGLSDQSKTESGGTLAENTGMLLEPAYFTDALCAVNGNDESPYRLHSITDNVNTLWLVEGRLPESSDECVVDNYMSDMKIGDEITITENNEAETLDMLKEHTLKVVGVARSPLYINFERGNTSIGTGKLTSFIYVLPEEFDTEYYTEVYVLLNADTILESLDSLNVAGGDQSLSEQKVSESTLEDMGAGDQALSEQKVSESPLEDMGAGDQALSGQNVSELDFEYEDSADIVSEKIENALTAVVNDRFGRIKSDAQGKIDDGIRELEVKKADALKDLEKAKEELDSGREEIDQHQKEIDDGRSKIEAGKAEIKKAKATLAEKRKQLEEGLGQLQAAGLAGQTSYAPSGEALQTAGLAFQTAGQAGSFVTQSADLAGQSSGLAEQTNNTLSSEDLQAAGRAEQTNNTLSSGDLQAAGLTTQANSTQLQAVREELLQAQKLLEEKEAELLKSERELLVSEQALLEGQEELDDARRELEEGQKEYDEAVIEFNEEIDKAQKEIDDAQGELDELEEPKSYVLDRDTNVGYASFESNSDIVASVANVFPVFFFAIAVLICMTTMNRMVEEQRTQIGVLKALGYSSAAIMIKYLFYAGTAALIGAVAGYIGGTHLLPNAIWQGYNIMYNMGPTVTYQPVPLICISSIAASLLCALGAAYYSVIHELREVPANLIRPKAPKGGKRIFLEYITPLWKRMKFLYKVSARNIIRYKKRFFMMVLGIGGCMALLLTGFGIGDSIKGIADLQYDSIQIYDESVTFAQGLTAEEMVEITKITGVTDITFMHQEAVDIIANDVTKSVTAVVPQKQEDLGRFLVTRDRQSGQEVAYPTAPGSTSTATGPSTVGDSTSATTAATSTTADAATTTNDSTFTVADTSTATGVSTSATTDATSTTADAASTTNDSTFTVADTSTATGVSASTTAAATSTTTDAATTTGAAMQYIPVLLTDNTADNMGLSEGDIIVIRDADMNQIEAKIAGITENHFSNYLYIPEKTNIFSSENEVEYNCAWIKVEEGMDLHEVAAALSKRSDVMNVSVMTDLKLSVNKMMAGMDFIVLVVILCAGALAFIVLYNLTNINITERVREIATIKVLGFYSNETAQYVFRENIVLTAIGALVGIPMGRALHAFIMYTIKIDMVSFLTYIAPISYLWSLLLTFGFAIVVNFFMRFKLAKINMAESLKSIE